MRFTSITKALAKSLGMTGDELLSSFQRASPSDLTEICQLRALGFGVTGPMDEAIIAWRYFDFSKNGSDIFILKINGSIIAAVGAEPISVKIDSQVYKGVRTGDIVVHPDHMKRGLGAWMNLYMQHHYAIVMAMGANKNSYSMVRRVFKPLYCRQQFKLLFSCDDYLYDKGLPKVLAVLTNKILWQPYCRLRLLGSGGFGTDYRCEISDNIEILEPFFLNQADLFIGQKCVLRTYDYFIWRYFQNPKSTFKYLCIYKHNEAVGFTVLKVDKSKLSAGATLMEWYIAPRFNNKCNLFKLFAEVVTFANREGYHALMAMTTDELSAKALKQNFFSLRSTDDGFYLFAQEHVPSDALDERGWFLTYTDTDEML